MLEGGASTEDIAAQIGSSVQAVRSLRQQFVQSVTRKIFHVAVDHE